MRIFGKPVGDYVAFSRWLIILVLIVGLARLTLSLTGTPNADARWLSMTVTMWLGVLYYSVRVHTSGFGSYRHLLGVVAFPNFVAQAVAIVGILTSIFTGNANIFSAPEYAFGAPGNTWVHVAAHVFVGTTVGTLAYWLLGCLFLFIAKKMTTRDRHVEWSNS